MSKKQPPKPLFPLRHDFVASLDNYTHQAGMLRDAASQLLKMGKITGPGADILRERVAAFDAARHEGEIPE